MKNTIKINIYNIKIIIILIFYIAYMSNCQFLFSKSAISLLNKIKLEKYDKNAEERDYIDLSNKGLNNKFLEYNYNKNSLDLNSIDTNNKNCNFKVCPIGKGTCYNDICICNQGFKTVKSSNEYCSYEQKYHSIAFFLEFFMPFGAGHFYSERLIFFLIKFCLFSFMCLFWCGDICNLRIRFSLNSKLDKLHIALVLINLIAFVGMHLFDLACFGFNIYKDGSNIEMF